MSSTYTFEFEREPGVHTESILTGNPAQVTLRENTEEAARARAKSFVQANERRAVLVAVDGVALEGSEA